MIMRDASIFVVVIAADRITKLIVPHLMDLHQSIPVIPGFFSFTYVRNSGGAFGILAAWDNPLRRTFFITASVAAIILLGFLYKQSMSAASPFMRLSLVFIAGGAFGNLYDRAFSGEVVDFLDFYLGSWHWPAFNAADSAIFVGAVLLAYLYFTGEADVLIVKQDSDVS